MAKQPDIGSYVAPRRGSQRVCSLCGYSPAGIVWIRFPWPFTRADDEKRACCKRCARNANVPALLEKKR